MAVYHVGHAPGSVFRAPGEPFNVLIESPINGDKIACPRRGEIPLAECEDCQNRRGSGEDGTYMLCAATGDEPVAAWMTPAVGLPMTTRTTTRAQAEQLLHDASAHHLLVLDDERILVGIVCACDLARMQQPTVGQCMSRDVYVTGPSTSLAEALAAMRALAISCLPVVRGPLVLGVLTRGDLGRAGAPGATDEWHCVCTR